MYSVSVLSPYPAMQLALAEMMLVGEADFVVTTPRSSYSALAAASGGASTQRIGNSYEAYYYTIRAHQ